MVLIAAVRGAVSGYVCPSYCSGWRSVRQSSPCGWGCPPRVGRMAVVAVGNPGVIGLAWLDINDRITSPGLAANHFCFRAVARTLLFPIVGVAGDYAATKRDGGRLSGGEPPPPRFIGRRFQPVVGGLGRVRREGDVATALLMIRGCRRWSRPPRTGRVRRNPTAASSAPGPPDSRIPEIAPPRPACRSS